jgi:hypothetical protein
MAVIRRWIDESDIFLLILGGRYGSIEPTNKKSYVHLEYEYAASIHKPLFAVIISEESLDKRVREFGAKIMEIDNPRQFKKFRSMVSQHMVRFWSDPRDIKIAILETLSVFADRDDLVGWIPGTEAVDTGALAEQLARLTKENAELREQVKHLSKISKTYVGLTFDEMYTLLVKEQVDWSMIPNEKINELEELAKIFGDLKLGLIHIFWMFSEGFLHKQKFNLNEEVNRSIIARLLDFGIIQRDDVQSIRSGNNIYSLTDVGREFLLRLQIERNVESAWRFVEHIAEHSD